jgi:hypothetical protein
MRAWSTSMISGAWRILQQPIEGAIPADGARHVPVAEIAWPWLWAAPQSSNVTAI